MISKSANPAPPALATIMMIVYCRRFTLRQLVSISISGLMDLLLIFANLYWQYGRDNNFNLNLSRLDAIYFAIGTFTTAGTGNIVATSEIAREIQSIQMIIDFGFAVVAFGILVARISSPN